MQAAGTTALCKLMLTSVITDEDLLKQGVLSYFDPTTKENAAVRQALTYFLPVYCHSKRENMARMASVAPAILHSQLNLSEEVDEEEELVGISAVGSMLVDWTDARKLVVQDHAQVSWDDMGRKEVKAANGDIHLDLAEALFERALTSGCSSKPPSPLSPLLIALQLILHFLWPLLTLHSEEEKKAITSMLGKLYITSNSSAEKLQTVLDLAAEAMDSKIAGDATGRNALNKLHTALVKALGDSGKANKSMAQEGPTTVDEDGGDAPEQPETIGAEGTQMEPVPGEGKTGAGDSLLEELLDDDEEEH